MIKTGRLLSGAALVIASAAIVSTAVAVDWPLMQLAGAPAERSCVTESANDCGKITTSGVVRYAQIALQAVMPSLRDDRRLPAESPPAPRVEVEKRRDASPPTGGMQGSASASDRNGVRGQDSSSVEDAEARARELARKLARSLAERQ
jgi:hypothetical protein